MVTIKMGQDEQDALVARIIADLIEERIGHFHELRLYAMKYGQDTVAESFTRRLADLERARDWLLELEEATAEPEPRTRASILGG